MSDYLSEDQVEKIQANNDQIQSMAKEIDVEEQARVDRLREDLKAVQNVTSPKKIASNALKRATGHGPLYYVVHDGIGTATRRTRAHHNLKAAGMSLFGSGRQMSDLRNTPPSPGMMLGGSLVVLTLVYFVYGSIFGRK